MEAHIPLLIIVSMSSKVPAAIIAVGSPLSDPYPLSSNPTRQGTTTDGEIQLRVYPRQYEIPNGMSKIHIPRMATVNASIV